MQKSKTQKGLLGIIEKIISVSIENFCCVSFFKNADLIAITKSSLLVSISFNTQKA